MSLELDIHPNTIVEELTGRDYVSFSAISTYQTCPLKWHYKYVLGLPEETVSASLVFGGAIHRAVEFHFCELLAGNSPPDLDTLLAEYQDEWRTRDVGTVRFGKGEDATKLGQLAERVLTAFQQSELAGPSGTILGVEEELRGQLSPNCPDLLARVDLLVDDGDLLTVTDLKTAKSRWSRQQAENSAEPLLLYGELARELLPQKPLRLQFAVITKAKAPVVETHAITVDRRRVERTKLVVERTWKAMQAGHVYPAFALELLIVPVSRAVSGVEGLTTRGRPRFPKRERPAAFFLAFEAKSTIARRFPYALMPRPPSPNRLCVALYQPFEGVAIFPEKISR